VVVVVVIITIPLNINNNNSILIYLHANLAAQRPITKLACVRKNNKKTYKLNMKKGSLYNTTIP
jgi:hypothetical protein